MITRSSLLLTVCCAIVVRYHEPALKRSIWYSLLRKLQSDLRETMLIVPHTIEFIQALVLMAIYASSLSYKELVIDAWFISSIGLEHFITKDVLGLVMSFDGVSPVTDMDEITAYRVWNHLCLVHVVNCNLSGRMLVLDRIRLNLSRRTLELRACSNFDGRMVAEISLQVIMYTFIESNQTFQEVEEELKQWLDQWGYLFEQPTTQFVETGYHFAYFVVLYHTSYRNQSSFTSHLGTNDSEEIDKLLALTDTSVLRRMIRHLIKVVESILFVKDAAYFMALSDQIHFFGAYASIMIVKLIEIARNVKTDFQAAQELFAKALNLATSLAAQFKILGDNSEEDLAVRYANAITEAIEKSSIVFT